LSNIWIQPAAGDAGGALGAATFVWHQLLDKPRTVKRNDSQHGSLLGPGYSNEQVKEFFDRVGAVYTFYPNEDDLTARIAELMATEHVVGHCAGRMEFGPRALGSRSILGDARSSKMQSVMNLKIKFRESFRPFAPAVLRERAHEFFEVRPNEDSPYMLLVAPVREERRVKPNGGSTDNSLNKVNEIRSDIPAVTHVDYSARVQTVDPERHPRFYKIIKAFEKRTGCPIVINTSFNVRGEPIVESPADSYRCFMGTNMDALVVENFLLLRDQQPQDALVDRQAYLSAFALD
jgi:carbamoyltransferase